MFMGMTVNENDIFITREKVESNDLLIPRNLLQRFQQSWCGAVEWPFPG
jgi:hypothetical protein